jgi:hypothetical protein
MASFAARGDVIVQLKRVAVISLFALCLTLSPARSDTVPITMGGGWSYFLFGDVGSSWDTTFEFTLAGSAELRVTDAVLSGDQFEIYINNVSFGLTSFPGSEGDNTFDNYDAAFADPRWSSGSYVLGPGTYRVSGIVTVSPFDFGEGAVQLLEAAAVPAPIAGAGIPGLVLACGGLLAWLRRRKQAKLLSKLS